MPVLFFDPGQFTTRLDLQVPQLQPDGQGGGTLSWQTAATLWARIEPMTFDFGEMAGQMRGRLTHRVWIRAREDIGDAMRFVKGQRAFAIRAIRDPDESGRYFVCLCEEDSL